MLSVCRCSKALVGCLLVSLFISSSWATLISKRHSIHLSVNEPDDPRFSLANLARIFYLQLDQTRKNRPKTAVRGVAGITGNAITDVEDRIGTIAPFTAAPGAVAAEPGTEGAAATELTVAGTRGRGRPNGLDLRNPYTINQRCDRTAEFRRINGTCNNLRRPFRGAAKTPLSRLTRAAYQDRFNAPRSTFFSSSGSLPTAREVSLAVHETTSNISSRHSHLMMNFGQFTDHDITLSPEAFGEGGVESPKDRCCAVDKALWINDLQECFPLSTASDPIFSTSCVAFVRSSPVPALPGRRRVRFQLNDLTAYIDGSQIYGSTNQRASSLRSFIDGKLRTSIGFANEVRLPLAADNPPNCLAQNEECRFVSGDVRNSEQAALTSVHTLMLREHNRIASALKTSNTLWPDEKLYQTTRQIIGAILQRITYREFLPEVVGPDVMSKYDLNLLETGRFTRYSRRVDASIVTEFSTAAFRFGHSMIRQTFGRSATIQLDVDNVFDAFKTVDAFGSDNLLQGLSDDNTEIRDRFISPGIRNRLFGGEMDLAAFNIQRGRDHGISSYDNIRRSLDLPRRNFSAAVGKTHEQTSIDALKIVYPRLADVEIFPGGLSEIPLSGAIVGETFANIIGKQFRRLKFGDRFWHETNNRITRFTNAQLVEIRKASLAGLYCQNVLDATVRKFLLIAETVENPTVDCSTIPVMDLSAWK